MNPVDFEDSSLWASSHVEMGKPPSVLALRQPRYSSFCLIAILLVTGWCRAAEVLSAEGGENDSLAIEDPGSQDRIVRGLHPKAPPMPTDEDRPPNSTLFNLEFEQGDWYVVIEDDTPDSEVRDLVRQICEESGEENGDHCPDANLAISAYLRGLKRGYKRTYYWFEKTGSWFVFDKYLANLVMSAADHPVNVLEVGSFEGGSALWIAEHLLLHPDSMLICIDLWTGGPDFKDSIPINSAESEDRFRHNMAQTPNNERVTAIKGDSLLSLSNLVAAGGTSTFDFIYVDGSHAMQHVLADAVLSFRLLKVGGLLIFDDTDHPERPSVRRATTALIEALEGEDCVEVLYDKNQVVARKTAEDPWITSASVVTMGKRVDIPLLSTFAAQPTSTFSA